MSTRDAEELARLDAAELALMREAQARARALEREGRSDGVSVDQSLGLPALPGWWPDHRREPGSWAPGGAGDDDGERAPVSQPAVPVTIVVPVYNALDELRACFAALVRNTTVPARILFVDDASTDPGLAQTLLEWRQFAGVELLRNSENQGFSATVNRGLRASPGSDVVVLNSDTAVTPQWLQRLISTAYSDPLTATVTPVSDNAGAFSVPRIGESNPVAPFLDNDGASRMVAQHSQMLRPRTPTANGFCMYIKRAVIDQVGSFDAVTFPRGYGEENDFCLRALALGWHHLVDDRVFIHHVREASFGPDKRRLIEQGRAQVDQRHPGYTALVREFVTGSMADVRSTVEHALRATRDSYDRTTGAGRELRPRILFVVHEGRGGTPATNIDLMFDLDDEYDCWLLASTGRELRLAQIADRSRNDVEIFKLATPLLPTDFSRSDYRAVVTEIIDRRAIELIHIRHLFKHTFDLPVVAASRGIPVVLSFHDYYFACPTVHLVDHRLDYCGGLCSAGDGDCHAPFDRPEGSLPSLKHRFVYQWRAEVQQALAGVDAFVTTSPQAREVHLRALPSLARRQFAVIEHGRDFTSATTATTTSAAPEPGGLVRIAVPGNLDLHKGAELMRAILAHDLSGRISFELLGDIPEQYADLGRVHGPYQRQELAARLTRIAPAFVGIFSIWAETYSHILSEAWAAGVPVIATNLGALRERVQRHGGGWLVDPDDPRGAVETILSIADDPDAYEHGRAGATVVNVRSVAEMSADYIALYRQVSDRRRVFVPRRAGAGMRHLSHGILRAAVIVPGAAGNFPGSTHVRLLRRLRHPSLQRKVQATIHHGSELSELPPDRHLVIVQRTAVAPERVDWFIDAIAARELPLVLDLDDDLFALGERDEEYGDQLASLERLLAAASLVTVSTPTLERVIARRGAPTLLIENMIDERLFFAGKGGPARRSRAANAPAQILYMGSPTHQRDLALLAPVLDRLRQDRVPMVLNVAGRFALGDQTDWYRSLPVPPGRGGYPQFIGWLRAQRQEWDFAVAPLVDTDFNRSKSDLKFLEYAALGLPGAFSQLTAYASVEHGVTGLLVENQADAWYEAIAQLADSPGLRDELAEHALEYVLSRRLLRHGADRLLSALFDLVAGSRDQAPRGL